jgi:hypothetical protein
MSQHTIYAYLVGSDLSDVSESLVERSEEFMESRTWICPRVWIVDQARLASDGVRQWDLGFNIDLADSHSEKPGWFADIEALVTFAAELRRELNHDFVVGISDNRSGCSEDILEIDSDDPDLDYLRRFIGA